jgi:DNA repair exonuclease SbcCD ATPase subunit
MLSKSSTVTAALVAGVIAILVNATPPPTALAQDKQVEQRGQLSTQANKEASQPRETFRARLQGYQKSLEQSGKDVTSLVAKLKGITASSVESRIVEVRVLREALVKLGAQLQADAPLAQSVDQYQSWIAAQAARLNNQRKQLGPEFVQELIQKYQTYQSEVTKAREGIANNSTAIDNALKELTTAEMRAGEMLMAEDAASAVKELVGVLQNVSQTVDDIRKSLRQLGTAGV